MELHQSAEDYLEKIMMIDEKKGSVRSIDIANELGFSKASVSIAMKKLRENGFILFDDDNYITLTPKGRNIAEEVYRKHKLLTKFFVYIGVPEETAAEDACKIEHHLSGASFDKLLEYAEKMGF